MPEHKQLDYIKPSVKFYPHQVDGIRHLAKLKSFLLADDMGLGKLSTLTEPVLTPTGWSVMGALGVGDFVVGADGMPNKVTAVHPQGTKEIVKVTFSDGSWTLCGYEHLWQVNTPVRKYRGDPPLVMTAREIVERGLVEKNGNRKWFIPMVAPVQFDLPSDHDLDPYLLGVLLGDGGLTHGCQLTTDDEIGASLVLPPGASMRQGNHRSEGISEFSFAGMRGYLRDLCLFGLGSHEKFIPEQYMWSSPENRIALLQGLLDTDGTTVESRGNPSTTVEYGTVSEKLAEQVRSLVQSLGGTVSIQEKMPTFTYNGEKKIGKRFYRMVLHLPSGIMPFRLERKALKWVQRTKYEPSRSIVSVDPWSEEEAVCITVANEDGLYVTRDFIVTHNSLQSLALAAIDVQMGWANKILVVSPATLKGNWEEEIALMTLFSSQVLEGTKKQRSTIIKGFRKSGIHILIVNYEQVTGHLDELNAIDFDITIFDEAHMIKTHNSKRTKACQKLNTKRNFLLTGSPMLGQVTDLWSLMARIVPDMENYFRYCNRYVVYGGYKDKQVMGVKNRDELHARLNEIMLRRLKEDELDLPPKNHIRVTVELGELQRKLYDEVVEEMRLTAPDPDAATPMEVENALTKFIRLKQICGTPSAISFGEDMDPYPDESPKLDEVVSRASEVVSRNGEHLVVFTQSRGVLSALVSRFKAAKLPTYQLHGGVPTAERQGVVRAWSDGPPAVIACMLQVAGVGLNMTKSSTVFMVDKLFVPKLMEQAEDRCYRIGQSKPVMIFEFITRNSIESRVEAILKNKKDLFDDVVETSNWKKKLYAAILEEEDE